jgi:hypothetical protein
VHPDQHVVGPDLWQVGVRHFGNLIQDAPNDSVPPVDYGFPAAGQRRMTGSGLRVSRVRWADRGVWLAGRVRSAFLLMARWVWLGG